MAAGATRATCRRRAAAVGSPGSPGGATPEAEGGRRCQRASGCSDVQLSSGLAEEEEEDGQEKDTGRSGANVSSAPTAAREGRPVTWRARNSPGRTDTQTQHRCWARTKAWNGALPPQPALCLLPVPYVPSREVAHQHSRCSAPLGVGPAPFWAPRLLTALLMAPGTGSGDTRPDGPHTPP